MSDHPGTINPPDDRVKDILSAMKRVAVVGISAKEDRASHGIARFLIGRGVEVLGDNPVLQGPVLGAEVYPSLAEDFQIGGQGREIPVMGQDVDGYIYLDLPIMGIVYGPADLVI